MAKTIKKILKISSKIFWGIVWGFFGLVVFVVLWLSVDKFIFKSPVPSFMGYSSLNIATGSMNGYSSMVEGGTPKQVNIGDMIIIKDTKDYKIGDVITFLLPGDTIPTTHRIIRIENGVYITKGDANNTQDTIPVAKEYILGEVVAHYPKLGQFSIWVKKEGWLYIFSALAILSLGGLILKASEEESEQTNETDNNGEDNVIAESVDDGEETIAENVEKNG